MNSILFMKHLCQPTLRREMVAVLQLAALDQPLNLLGNLLIAFGLVDRLEIPGRWKSVLIFGRRAHTPSQPTFKARSMNSPINPKRMVTKTFKSFRAAKYRKNGVTIIPNRDTYFNPLARFSK